VWRCEDVDQQMWRCEDVDQQMWRCEDVVRCRSADVKVWRCSITAVFLRRTLRRRSREKVTKRKVDAPARSCFTAQWFSNGYWTVSVRCQCCLTAFQCMFPASGWHPFLGAGMPKGVKRHKSKRERCWEKGTSRHRDAKAAKGMPS